MTPLRTVDIEVQQVVVVRLHTIPLAPDNRGPEYDPVVTYNDLVVQIDNDIVAVYRFVADICAAKFPELHSLTRVVKTIARWTVGSLWRIYPQLGGFSVTCCTQTDGNGGLRR
ncbi:hypothetical protein PI126_g8691 [Phytophthora idaei]|nr:hypothetical protein PI126_g8691 [Phytophthora idaei]